MKKTFLFLSVCISLVSVSQTPQQLGSKVVPVLNPGMFEADSIFRIGAKDTTANKLAFPGRPMLGRIVLQNGVPYIHNGLKFVNLASGSGGLDSVRVRQIISDSLNANTVTFSSDWFTLVGGKITLKISKLYAAIDSYFTIKPGYVGDGTGSFRDNLIFSPTGDTSVSGPVLEDLAFTGIVNMTDTGHVWTGTTGSPGNFANYALATKKLASGQDGYIEFQYVDNRAFSAILAFNTSNTSQSYGPSTGSNNYEAAVFLSTNGTTNYLVKIDATGSIADADVGVQPTVGYFYGIERTGTTTTPIIRLRRRSGSTITYPYTFPSFTGNGGDLFININNDNGAKTFYPKGYNVQ